ncbi:hypothetical protein RchiOBHm_Chr2g0098501 [Rosa chinensis]|uniref:Uncharacterized protein n=1 Tax=Rosa chinensis TaxID=74649 RepID=A0A2P6RLL6_ROSCH|nr:hypothetical protein RchiOBHm_Chr2g0098501 [Rosa chinensis]
MELDNMANLSDKYNFQIPMESLREHQLEELDQTFPDEGKSYREIRVAASAISCITLITQSRLCAHPRNVTRVF